MPTSDYDAISARHKDLVLELAMPMVSRLDASPSDLAAHRQEKLSALLTHASKNSAWHRKRLEDIDLSSIRENDLTSLPSMSKDDLMESWDEISTTPTLTLNRAEAHLDALQGPAYLDERFHVVASGGSSGKRGVFAYDWNDWAVYYLTYVRWFVRQSLRKGTKSPAEMSMASIGAKAFTHPTVALLRTFGAAGDAALSFPVSMPVTEIIAGLNAVQPDSLIGYASILGKLAVYTQSGELKIAPTMITSTAEPLLPETAAAIEKAWGFAPINTYGTSDAGVVAVGCGEAGGMHLNEDELIIEAVDRNGNAVAPGEKADKLFVTVLFQYAMPLIRYELTDETQTIIGPCPCGSPFRRIKDVQGRLDDIFIYAGESADETAVHPHVFRSVLARTSAVVEYQVRQTRSGAKVAVTVSSPIDPAVLRQSLEEALAGVGLKQPSVNVECVEELGRQGVGKLKRFIPLAV
jgi:phenylacetate-CoA ligase